MPRLAGNTTTTFTKKEMIPAASGAFNHWKTMAVNELAILTATLAITTIPSASFVIDSFDPVLKASISKEERA